LHTPSASDRLVSHLLAFFEGLEATACYARVVHEEVFASIIWRNKAIAFVAVEPLNCSLGHVLKLVFLSLGFITTKKAAPLLRAGRRFTAAINLNFHCSCTIAKYGLKAPSIWTPAFLFTPSISRKISLLAAR
jgi:hypothetical protein